VWLVLLFAPRDSDTKLKINTAPHLSLFFFSCGVRLSLSLSWARLLLTRFVRTLSNKFICTPRLRREICKRSFDACKLIQLIDFHVFHAHSVYSKFNENFYLGTKTGFAAGKQQQMFTSTIKAIAYIFGGDKFVDFVSMKI
jgi:hypothetical protein